MRRSPRRLVALVDCENFYVSCERAFDPSLDGRPVAVLSNNDGCIVARSEEVKALGVRMGAPFFEVRPKLGAAAAAVYSSNYELYGDVSRRVMDALETFTPDVEVYSIDEAFLGLPALRHGGGLDREALSELALSVRACVRRWTGVPVRVSVAETKTLAKAGSAFAKRLQKGGGEPVVSLAGMTPDELDAALASVPVADVWGIGPAHTRRLLGRGAETALDLRDLDDRWIRQHLHVPGLRTVYELRGLSCIPLEKAPPARKSMVRSRSFSRPVTDPRELREAVATHCARACERLRAEGLAAAALQVFITTGHPEARGPHRSVSLALPMPYATSATPDVLRHAHYLLGRIWAGCDERPGSPTHGRPYPYRKAGVVLLELTRAGAAPAPLFGAPDPRADVLMGALDRVNRRFGSRTVTFGAEGSREPAGEAGGAPTETGQPWAMRRERLSPRYTTRWGELPVVRAT